MPRITPLSPRILIKVFERFGFCVAKRKPGDHIQMKKTGCIRPLVIPDYDEIPVFIIVENLRSAKISREEFFKALDDL